MKSQKYPLFPRAGDGGGWGGGIGALGLGPSINRLVTDGNTKLCCRGFILALFQSTPANKIDSEHTQDYKRLLPVCKVEILRVTVK